MRIGAVSYLNTKPLVHGLAELAPRIEIVYDLPSRLADELAAERLDVALIPSVEYFQNPDYAIVSDAETHVKMACGDPKAAFRVAILDPTLADVAEDLSHVSQYSSFRIRTNITASMTMSNGQARA